MKRCVSLNWMTYFFYFCHHTSLSFFKGAEQEADTFAG